MVWLVLLQIFLIALNAIFAGTEIAVISVKWSAATSVPSGSSR